MDSSVNFYPKILLLSVFEGPCIALKLFQYCLCMLNIEHGLASLPQTADLCYITGPQRKQLPWQDVGRGKPLGSLLNIFSHLKAWLKSKRLKADNTEFTLKFLCLNGKLQSAGFHVTMWDMQDYHKQKILKVIQ